MDEQQTEKQIEARAGMTVTQANDLIRKVISEGQHWSAIELKLVKLLIAQVRQDDAEIYPYSAKVSDLARIFGVSEDRVYKVANQTVDNLLTRLIRIKTGGTDKRGNPNERKFQWLTESQYEDGTFHIRLHPNLKPFVLDLQELFTQYPLEAVLKLPTANAIRLYELLASWQNATVRPDKPIYFVNGERLRKDEIAFTIKELREYFECLDKYPNGGDFIRRVINPAAKAIRESGEMPLQSWRLGREGRNISHVVFRIGWGRGDP